jgi:pimeloyl-ACP methyl ester carboxylesterase
MALVLGAATAGTYLRYRRDIAAARRALAQGGKVIATRAGPIEYADEGAGDAVLVIHGAGGGYDQGLLIGRDLPAGHRLIAPSRFGYLRTPIPPDSSIAAQADAHAALLDALAIDEAIVVGVSAGAPSAIELALKYPRRVKALILLVPRAYDPSAAVGPDQSTPSRIVLTMIETSADFLFWLAIPFARSALVRFFGIRPELERNATEEDHARITRIMRGILPLSERVAGIDLDGRHRLEPWPLGQIAAPTLIVSAEDDLFGTLPGARFTASHIAGAELKVLESGGHLMLGQTERVRGWIADFLQHGCPSDASSEPGPAAHEVEMAG